MAAKRKRLLAALPDALRLEVEKTSLAYQDLSSSLSIEKRLTALCKELLVAVTEQVDSEFEQKDALIKGIEKLRRALANGTFIKGLFPQTGGANPFNLQAMMNSLVSSLEPKAEPTPDSIISREDLDGLIKNFQALLSFVALEDEDNITLPTLVAPFFTILKDAKALDTRALSSDFVDMIEPSLHAIRSRLHHLCSMLTEARIELPSDADLVLIEALDFWLTQFKTYQETITAFLSLASSARTDLSVVLRLMSQLYDLSSCFFVFYRYELFGNDEFIGKANMIDAGLRTSIVAAAMFHRFSESASKELEKCLLSKDGLAQFANPLGQAEYPLFIMASTLTLFLNPKAFAPHIHPIRRMIWRIVGTVIIHHVLENFQDPVLWPKRDYWLKIVLSVALWEAQSYLSS